MNEITCHITKNTNIVIKTKTTQHSLNQPLFAVNWFSTKVSWLYHLYNFLASKSLQKIGGKPFFKGAIEKVMFSDSKLIRDFILIVEYPNGKQFKALLENTYFKLVSILRIGAVKKFSFGFTQKITATETTLKQSLKYVVHVFKGKEINLEKITQFKEIKQGEVHIKYSGVMIAELFKKGETNAMESIPNAIDGVIVFESVNEKYLEEMITSTNYTDYIKTLEASFIGTVNRIL